MLSKRPTNNEVLFSDFAKPTRKRRYSRGARQRKDREWVEGIRRGDQRAFEELYAQYSPGLYGVIRQVVQDEQKAAELLQDVMMRVWKYVGTSYDPTRGGLFTWLVHVARNQAKQSFVRTKKRVETCPMETNLLDYYGHCQQPSFEPGGVVSLLEQLEPQQRRFIELVYLQGYSYKEAGQMLGIVEAGVGSFRQVTMNRLRRLVKQSQLYDDPV